MFKAYGEAKDSSSEHFDATKHAVKLLMTFLNDKMYSIYAPSVVMNSMCSVFLQMIVQSDVNLDEFSPCMIEAVSDLREHIKKVEDENVSRKD